VFKYLILIMAATTLPLVVNMFVFLYNNCLYDIGLSYPSVSYMNECFM